MLGALAAAASVSGYVLAEEHIAATAEARLRDQTAAFDAGTVTLPPADTPRGSVPRVRFADALMSARAAQRLNLGDARRGPLLDRASTELSELEGARPYWGERDAAIAFVETLRSGDTSPTALHALSQSYREAPYLRQSGSWRVEYGLREWENLDSEARAHLLDEAVWLSRDDVRVLNGTLDAMRGTQAYRGFMTRWVISRRDDADFGPVDGLPPQ
jgi:hypothetical protein